MVHDRAAAILGDRHTGNPEVRERTVDRDVAIGDGVRVNDEADADAAPMRRRQCRGDTLEVEVVDRGVDRPGRAGDQLDQPLVEAAAVIGGAVRVGRLREVQLVPGPGGANVARLGRAPELLVVEGQPDDCCQQQQRDQQLVPPYPHSAQTYN